MGKLLYIDALETGRVMKCPTCGKEINLSEEDIFRNEISKKEYTISGMCQECQDRVFGED